MNTAAIAETGYKTLPLSMLDESSTNPRRTFEPTKLVELARLDRRVSEEQFQRFLLEVYHHRPSSEGKLSPKERWEQDGFLPRMPDNVEN